MIRPYVWQMIKDAIDFLDREVQYSELKSYIHEKWGEVNDNTITAQIIALTVNHGSRTYYNENHRARWTNGGSDYDLLYTTGRGKVVKYNPLKHGVWEIYSAGPKSYKIRSLNVNAYLFAWNPNNWDFDEMPQLIEDLKSYGTAKVKWSVQTHKSVRIGDLAFICQVGVEKKGLFASGVIISEPFPAPHWNGSGELVNRVFIELDSLINPNKSKILDVETLRSKVSSAQHWTPQASGIQIRNECIKDLEKVWFNFLNSSLEFSIVEEYPILFIEGQALQISQTIYERNRYARDLCLQKFGYSCSVCDFNFTEIYGDIGNGFIHVHHLTELSSIADSHVTDPINDLRPVCPNCHAMLHKKRPPYTIQELKDLRKN